MGNQEQHNLEQTNNSKKEADLKELILVIQEVLRFLLKKWKIIIIALLIGALLGGIKAKLSKIVYLANSTFVIDNGQSNAVGGLSFFGLGGNKNTGLFDETDNIVWLYKTQAMIQKSLLSVGKKDNKEIMMIEWFEDASHLKKEINKQPSLAKLKFLPNQDYTNLSREQNALLGWCSNEILNKYLSIKKIDKTENIVTVTIKSEDEAFAKAFNDILVNTVNNFYIETKTQKAAKEVILLEEKLDSFKFKMNASMVQVAEATDNVPYPNPSQTILRVAPQKRTIDAQIQSTMYTEIAKNLEQSKISLAKLTPLIQVIEAPNLPLDSDIPSFKNWLIIGGFLGTILTVLWFSILFIYKKIMQ